MILSELSPLFQLLDEIAILWVIMAGFALWYPKQGFPLNWENLPDGRKKFKILCIAFSILSTFLGFIQPVGSNHYLKTRTLTDYSRW